MGKIAARVSDTPAPTSTHAFVYACTPNNVQAADGWLGRGVVGTLIGSGPGRGAALSFGCLGLACAASGIAAANYAPLWELEASRSGEAKDKTS